MEQSDILQELIELQKDVAQYDPVHVEMCFGMELELNEIMKRAREELIRTAARRFYRKQIAEDKVVGDGLLALAVKRMGKDSFIEETRGRKKQTTKKLITINAKDGIDPVKFWNQMSKCIKKSALQAKQAKYVLEQRSEEQQEPYGWHIHWLVDFEATSSTAIIVQQVYQCFTRYLTGSNYVDVKDVPDDHWEHKEKYITGGKKDEKMKKVEKDRKLREELGIPEIIVY